MPKTPAIPTRILIGGRPYQVNRPGKESLNDNVLGDIDLGPMQINVRSDLSAVSARSVLTHEIVHGLLMFTGDHWTFRDQDEMEGFTRRFANALEMLLATNPGFVALYPRRAAAVAD